MNPEIILIITVAIPITFKPKAIKISVTTNEAIKEMPSSSFISKLVIVKKSLLRLNLDKKFLRTLFVILPSNNPNRIKKTPMEKLLIVNAKFILPTYKTYRLYY